jgi:hypothetical protein
MGIKFQLAIVAVCFLFVVALAAPREEMQLPKYNLKQQNPTVKRAVNQPIPVEMKRRSSRPCRSPDHCSDVSFWDVVRYK